MNKSEHFVFMHHIKLNQCNGCGTVLFFNLNNLWFGWEIWNNCYVTHEVIELAEPAPLK